MWTIISMMIFVCVFELVYSICVNILYDNACHPQRISNVLDSAFSFIDRSVGYTYWFWPIIYMFWPSTIRQEEKKKYKEAKRI